MLTVGVGLLMPRRLPRSPWVVALRREPRVRIVFHVHDVRDVPQTRWFSPRSSAEDAEEAPGPSESPGKVAASPGRTDVIVADMDIGAGVRTVLRTARARCPGVPIMMLDRAGDSARAQRARNLGVAAVLTRRCPPERFIARLLDVARDSAWAPEIFGTELSEPLTPREWDILPYIAQRYSAKEIAEDLTISYATVRTHIRNIYAKCGVGSRRHAAFVAESLLRERYNVGDTIGEEVSRDDELRRRDGRSDPEPERVQVHPGPARYRRG